MEQIGVQKFSSECGRVLVFIQNDMPLGEIHDYLLKLKGEMVSRINSLQVDEEIITKKVREKDLPKEDIKEEECLQQEQKMQE